MRRRFTLAVLLALALSGAGVWAQQRIYGTNSAGQAVPIQVAADGSVKFALTITAFEFEGATDDGFETSLDATDPTADRTITLPDATGTVALTGYGALTYDGDSNNDGTYSASTLTIAAADTYTQFAATTAGSVAGSVTCSATSDDCSTSTAGTFQVTLAVAARPAADTKTVAVAVFKEGAVVSACKTVADLAATAFASLAVTCVTTASANDSFDVRILNATDDVDVDVAMLQLAVIRIG